MCDFPGFPAETQQFLRELRENNSRDWFAANKARYEEAVTAPALAWVAAMGARLPPGAEQPQHEPQAGGRGQPARQAEVVGTGDARQALGQSRRPSDRDQRRPLFREGMHPLRRAGAASQRALERHPPVRGLRAGRLRPASSVGLARRLGAPRVRRLLARLDWAGVLALLDGRALRNPCLSRGSARAAVSAPAAASAAAPDRHAQ